MKTDKMRSIEELLPLYIDDKLTEEENVRVQNWLSESPEHLKLMQSMLELCLDIDALEVMTSVDTEKALKRVGSRIKAKSRKTMWTWVRNVAAVMFIPLVGFVTYMYIDKSHNLDAADNVYMMEFRANPGMTGKVLLPDGSNVILNSGSVLRYPSKFASDEDRVVEFQGEGYFDVSHDEKRIFIVKTSSDERIEVYGTEFNLDAYPGRNSIATLVEGSISFCYNDKDGNHEKIMMTPNHKLEFNHNSGIISMMETSCKAETAWKDNEILLERTSMVDILEILSKRYDVDFVVKDTSITNMTFSGGIITMNRLEQLLESLSISSSIKWRYLPFDNTNQKQKIELY
jgi:ferric-dicitrate binding protein FerR (iron transport regulator)